MGQMHAASTKTARMSRALKELMKAGSRGLTTRQWANVAGIEAAGTVASELRRNGHDVRCALEHITDDGGRIHRYTYHGKLPS